MLMAISFRFLMMNFFTKSNNVITTYLNYDIKLNAVKLFFNMNNILTKRNFVAF